MNIELSKARLLIPEASLGDSVDGARVIADAVEMVDCPTVESYAGGASEGGVGSRVTIRINGALVEYAPIDAYPPSLLVAARQVESWWVEENIGGQLGGAPACMFNLRAALAASAASRAGSKPVAGLVRMTDEDAGRVTLQFDCDESAQAFQLGHDCTVDIDEWSAALADIAPAAAAEPSDPLSSNKVTNV